MTALILRSTNNAGDTNKNAPLTAAEVDGNFIALKTTADAAAPLASPTFTGTPSGPTAGAGANSPQLATTAHVFAERSNTATLTNKTIVFANSPTVTAAGTNQGTATAIANDYSVVTSVSAGTGVILPVSTAGRVFAIKNAGANPLLVYPSSGGVIDSLAANAAWTLPVGAAETFVFTTTTTVQTLEGRQSTTNTANSAVMRDSSGNFSAGTVTANLTGTASANVNRSGDTLTGALNYAAIATLASGATVAIGAATSNAITITGTTTITAFDSIAAGAERCVTFAGALTLTYNATSLILPTSSNITTTAGDVGYFISLGSGNWKCTGYQKANGGSLLSSGLSSSIPLTLVSGTTQTAVFDNHYALTNVASTTLTLPATPSSGWIVWVTVANSLTTNVVARNGSNIMSLAEDMTLDNQNIGYCFRYINSTVGWVLI